MNSQQDIIFDLGGVVLRWDPVAIIDASFDEPHVRQLVRKEIFNHPDWGDLDRGLLSPERLIEKASVRTGLPHARISAMFDRVLPSLEVMPGTVSLLRRLKARGHRLFCLSNMYREGILHLESVHDFFELFTASVISCRVGAIKPDPEIYLRLLQDNALVGHRTVFFDDLLPNVQAARSLGINAFVFTSAADCEAILQALGYLPRAAPDRQDL